MKIEPEGLTLFFRFDINPPTSFEAAFDMFFARIDRMTTEKQCKPLDADKRPVLVWAGSPDKPLGRRRIVSPMTGGVK